MQEKKLKADAASRLITESQELSLLNKSEVLDLACGSGRNGLWFADKGHRVTFIDKSLANLSVPSEPHTGSIPTGHTYLAWDLEDGSAPELAQNKYDLVLVFNYLHRPLFPQIAAAVKPGGLIIYETFIDKQAEIGRPRNPKFLLKANELKNEFEKWALVHYFEGEVMNGSNFSYKAQLIARKPNC
ncbi:methyltransferase domain-containing protein [Shewanella sp.]|uniref:class I SAM-dependent methyltransferase n=1 Tax=Shewanella sp. TaxID=50422 RepID=UPI00258CD3CA|nr:methyltransferase domain-containing protein [Shewanella sp.]MCJ8301599.1 methyltransferase domain-containing protein [Shewanella sp.]